MRKTYAVLILAGLLGGCPSDDDEKCTTDPSSDDSAGSSSGSKPKPGQFGSGAAMPCADENEDDDENAGSGGKGGKGSSRDDAVGSIGSIGGKAGASGGKAGSSGSKGGAGGSSGGAGGAGAGPAPGGSGSSSSDAGEAFAEVALMLDSAQCACAGMEDVFACTGVTAAENACQTQAAKSAGSTATAWLTCAAELLGEALDCFEAAECSEAAIQECPVVGTTNPGAALLSECGTPPTALSDAIGACTPAEPSDPGSDGDACGNPLYVCDGEEDCADGSDEKNCFVCEDGLPIPPEWVCDDEADCTEGEDESAGNCGGPGASPAP